jgi:hypothetical protein
LFAPDRARAVSVEHAAEGYDSSLNTIPDDESSAPTIAPPPPAPKIVLPASKPSGSSPISLTCQLSISTDQPQSESHVRIAAIRVAIRKPTRSAKSFSVERLDRGQRLPAGTIEAMLVITGELDS